MIDFYLYDRAGKWVGHLDGVADYDIEHNTTLDTLELELCGNTVAPVKGDRVVFFDDHGPRECLVQGITDTDGEEGRTKTVYCEDSLSELRCKVTSKVDGGEKSSTLLGTFTDSTAWDAGTQGQVEKFTATDVTNLEGIVKLAEAQDGSIKTEFEVSDTAVTKRTVSIVQPDEDFSGIRFDYGRNIESVERIVEEDDVYTKIVARGGTYKTQEQVYDETLHDWLWKDVTKKYEAVAKDDGLLGVWGWPTKSGTRHSECIWNASDYSNESMGVSGDEFSQTVQDALAAAAARELKANGPKISYSASVEVFDEPVRVGQKVQIVHSEMTPELRLEGSVVKTNETPEGKTVTIGTIASTLADTVLRQSSAINGVTGGSSAFYTRSAT